jgi:hypothetical protein
MQFEAQTQLAEPGALWLGGTHADDCGYKQYPHHKRCDSNATALHLRSMGLPKKPALVRAGQFS